MSGSITRIEGFKEARETLQQLSATVQRNVGKRALKPAAEIIAAEVRGKAAVSTAPYNTTPGSLRDSIKVVSARAEKGGARIAILADDIAAAQNEFGNSDMAAQPFFRPGVGASQDRAFAAFGAALKPEIETAARKAAKRASKQA